MRDSNKLADDRVGLNDRRPVKVCKVRRCRCSSLEWTCDSAVDCIAKGWVCDGRADCPDESDEADAVCARSQALLDSLPAGQSAELEDALLS